MIVIIQASLKKQSSLKTVPLNENSLRSRHASPRIVMLRQNQPCQEKPLFSVKLSRPSKNGFIANKDDEAA
ncbi:hypothetical protein ACA618_06870 [Lactiplantibacillus pentosus]|jgi:hypothetical protein|uniref:hypothetical protein n=1 Tax=Lactiplantibacillus pentosus TaxID=1589 RepID=UPI0013051F44|nr:hypothetical protein [Lactiplantibacillus pentosus]